MSGQEGGNTAQIAKSLTITEKANDGKHAVIVSNFRNGGPPPESFSYEFVRQGNAWKISDVIFPNGDRFSHTDCGIGQREDHQPRPLAASSKANAADAQWQGPGRAGIKAYVQKAGGMAPDGTG